MPLFIKTEQFTKETLNLLPLKRHNYLQEHISWVKKLKAKGKQISSGYLINKNKKPGGGGLLLIEATCFQEAKQLVEQDPMIKNKLVKWTLQEWVSVSGNLSISS